MINNIAEFSAQLTWQKDKNLSCGGENHKHPGARLRAGDDEQDVGTDARLVHLFCHQLRQVQKKTKKTGVSLSLQDGLWVCGCASLSQEAAFESVVGSQNSKRLT